MSEKQNTTTRRVRLTADQRRTAWQLRCMFVYKEGADYIAPTRGERVKAGIHIKRLAEDAGIERAGMNIADTYEAAMRVLRSRGDDLNVAAGELRNMAWAWCDRPREAVARRNAEAVSAPTSQGEPQREKQTINLNHTWNREDDFGLHDGDAVTVVEAMPEELRRGDFTGIFNASEKTWYSVGYFEGADALAVDVTQTDGSHEYPRHADFKFYLILSVKRTEHFERPQKNATCPSAPAQTGAAAKVRRLKQRLERLGDDITGSTQRFKIERAIYDLEREAAADEWPEIIGEGGTK